MNTVEDGFSSARGILLTPSASFFFRFLKLFLEPKFELGLFLLTLGSWRFCLILAEQIPGSLSHRQKPSRFTLHFYQRGQRFQVRTQPLSDLAGRVEFKHKASN